MILKQKLIIYHRITSVGYVEIGMIDNKNKFTCLLAYQPLSVILCLTELFEAEMFICLKMDLALNFNGWYVMKPNQSNCSNVKKLKKRFSLKKFCK